MIGSDLWAGSDDAFALFLATVAESDWSPWELRAYRKAVEARLELDRMARLNTLKEAS